MAAVHRTGGEAQPPLLWTPAAPVGVACQSSASATEPGTEVLERDDFRRGVGICVMNKHGMVFAARCARLLF